MKNALPYSLDIQKMCEVKGRLHVLFVDAQGVITACNKLKADFFRDMVGVDNIIGVQLSDILDKLGSTAPLRILEENSEILKRGVPHQFLQTWTIRLSYRLDLLTCKIPVYDPSGSP